MEGRDELGDFFSSIVLWGQRDQDKRHLAKYFLNALCHATWSRCFLMGQATRLARGLSLGLSPGSRPGLKTEQSTRGIELGKAFLNSWEWAYRFRAGNSFECMLWGFPDFIDSQGPRGAGLPASPRGSEVPFPPEKSLSSSGNPTSFALFQSILFYIANTLGFLEMIMNIFHLLVN